MPTQTSPNAVLGNFGRPHFLQDGDDASTVTTFVACKRAGRWVETEEALSAAGALWSPSDRTLNRYFEAMVGFTQPFFITPCDGRKLR